MKSKGIKLFTKKEKKELKHGIDDSINTVLKVAVAAQVLRLIK